MKSYRANNNSHYSSTPSTDGKKYTGFHSLTLAYSIVSAGTGSSSEAAQDKRGKIVEKINGWAGGPADLAVWKDKICLCVSKEVITQYVETCLSSYKATKLKHCTLYNVFDHDSLGNLG